MTKVFSCEPLTHEEMTHAAWVGINRRLDSIKRNRTEKTALGNDSLWDVDVESAATELLVAKNLGLYWNCLAAEPHKLDGDVGNVEVRHTQYYSGHLVVSHEEKDDSPFVLVVGKYPRYEIRGWLFGKAAKQKAFWRDRHTAKTAKKPAYFVPQEHLISFDVLQQQYHYKYK